MTTRLWALLAAASLRGAPAAASCVPALPLRANAARAGFFAKQPSENSASSSQ